MRHVLAAFLSPYNQLLSPPTRDLHLRPRRVLPVNGRPHTGASKRRRPLEVGEFWYSQRFWRTRRSMLSIAQGGWRRNS